jgi:hypothetical protein
VDNVEETTNSIPVQLNGVAKLFFNDTMTASALIVGSDTSGRGIPYSLANTTTSLTLASAYIGQRVGPVVGATGTISKVLINPGFDRVSG